MSATIEASDLGVRFELDRQQRPVTPAMSRIRLRCTTIWGLRHVNFSLESGSGVALIGANGAGKSTLLRVLAGVYPADEGSVRTQGRICSLLSVEAGLILGLTGRENILLMATMTDLSLEEARAAIDGIRELSGLGPALERPVGTYSQGMRARLSLAVVEQADPEILLLDEIFEALDAGFRRRLEEQVQQIRSRGGIVVAAGHDQAELAQICDSALVLDRDGTHFHPCLDMVIGDRVLASAGRE